MEKISVFCGSSYGNDAQVKQDIKDLGVLLGKKAACILYGGGLYGHLQDLMDSVGQAGGRMEALISPAYFDESEVYPDYVTVIKVRDDEERIKKFLEADAFVVTPGGDGTLAESFFAHNRNLSALFQKSALKPVIFLDTNGFYTHLKEHFKQMSRLGYSNEKRQGALHFETTPQAVITRLWP